MQACIPAILKKITTMSDRGVRILIDTNEITPETFTEIYSHLDNYGYFFFSDKEIKEIDKSKLPELKEGKSKSQQLRSVLFRFWEQEIGNKQSFEDFYNQSMDTHINLVKSKLI